MRTPRPLSLAWRFTTMVTLLAVLLLPPAQAQSEALGRQSQASLAASVEVPVVVVGALAEGAKFMVSGVQLSGGAVAVTVSAVGVGASFVVYLAAETAAGLAIAAGMAVEVIAVGTGWLLSAGGEALCFVANEQTRPHLHSRELGV
ncbi:MAG: hypothetical protein E6Q88_02070 [Lysobacteraceae bacterium]|nr:MAG: hypothetical protein E6Q88_02070 [Xanthomonadaceae bacterium]